MRRIKAILVHGTFANETDWDNPDAPFSQGLQAKLRESDAELRTEEFRWSGDNSHEARRVAAEDLAEKLRREGFDGYDELFLIGHSHGGTVSRLALNKLDDEQRPTGVFTLGTPFVRFKRKNIRLVAGVITFLLRALAFVSVAMMTRIFYVQDWIADAIGDPNLHLGATAIVGLFLGWLLALAAPSLLRRAAAERLMRTQDEIVAEYDPPEKTPTPYVCFHAFGDEAGLLLRFWSMITWVLQTGVFIMFYGAILLLLLAVPMMAYQAAITFELVDAKTTSGAFSWFVELMRKGAYAIGLEINDPDKLDAATVSLQVPQAAAFSSLAIFGTLVLTALLSTPLTVFAPWALRKQWFAFGGEKLEWNLAADIQVDRKANSISRMRYVFMPRAWFKGAMQHNFYYCSHWVIDDIARRMLNFTPASPGLSLDLERFVSRLITVFILALVVLSAIPFTWVFAELMTEPPIDPPIPGAPQAD